MRFALIGYGRMGRAIEEVALGRDHVRVVAVDPGVREPGVVPTLSRETLADSEVAFEFTGPDTVRDNVVGLLESGVRVVCGTTGWDVDVSALREIARSSGSGAVIAPNFSLGMNLFYRLVEQASAVYGSAEGYQPYVVEWHHSEKADCPSGTALRLADVVARSDARGPTVRTGDPRGALGRGALHVTGVRAGTQPGRHTVGFDGPHDEVTLTHQSRGRSGFAMGAVLAGEWIATRDGIHDFDEVITDILFGTKGGAE